MAMAEFWFDNVMKRKYLTTILFDDPSSWSDNDVSHSSESWKTLNLPDVADMFQVRVIRSGTAVAPLHQILLYRTAMGTKFGETPMVGIHLKVAHNDEIIHESESERLTWRDRAISTRDNLSSRIENRSIASGYQEYFMPMSILLKNESFQRSPSFTLIIKITITMNSGEDDIKIADPRDRPFRTSLSRMLTDPSYGNVEFVFGDKNGQVEERTQKLYAFSHVWEDSAFANCCIFLIPSGETASESSNSSPSTSSSLFPPHRSIPITYDFELFHLVLHYFYTHRFCFITTPETLTTPDVPTTLDAEGIYEIAYDLKIEPLEKKALHFLQATCNVDNITSRAFSSFAATHKNVGKVYDDYFMEQWNKVKNSTEFEKFFRTVEDPVEERKVNTKFRKMMRERT